MTIVAVSDRASEAVCALPRPIVTVSMMIQLSGPPMESQLAFKRVLHVALLVTTAWSWGECRRCRNRLVHVCRGALCGGTSVHLELISLCILRWLRRIAHRASELLQSSICSQHVISAHHSDRHPTARIPSNQWVARSVHAIALVIVSSASSMLHTCRMFLRQWFRWYRLCVERLYQLPCAFRACSLGSVLCLLMSSRSPLTA